MRFLNKVRVALPLPIGVAPELFPVKVAVSDTTHILHDQFVHVGGSQSRILARIDQILFATVNGNSTAHVGEADDAVFLAPIALPAMHKGTLEAWLNTAPLTI